MVHDASPHCSAEFLAAKLPTHLGNNQPIMFGRHHWFCHWKHGYGSIPIDTFLVGWTSIYQLFWGSLGTRVLTHPHIFSTKKICDRNRNSFMIFGGTIVTIQSIQSSAKALDKMLNAQAQVLTLIWDRWIEGNCYRKPCSLCCSNHQTCVYLRLCVYNIYMYCCIYIHDCIHIHNVYIYIYHKCRSRSISTNIGGCASWSKHGIWGMVIPASVPFPNIIDLLKPKPINGGMTISKYGFIQSSSWPSDIQSGAPTSFVCWFITYYLSTLW